MRYLIGIMSLFVPSFFMESTDSFLIALVIQGAAIVVISKIEDLQ